MKGVNPTKTQKKILDFMMKFESEHGRFPVLREIAEYMGYSNTSSAQYYLRVLKIIGYLGHYFGTSNYFEVKKDIKYPTSWEEIPFTGIKRLKVPGGWFVCHRKEPMFKFDDTDHRWELED